MPSLVADRDQQLVELGRFARVEAGRRLVEAEQPRLGAHGARDLEPALRAIGQLAGRPVGIGQRGRCAPASARAFSTAARLGAAIALQAEQAEDAHARGAHQLVVLGDHQVLQHRHAGKQADVLEGARHPRLLADLVAAACAPAGTPASPRRVSRPTVGL